MTSTIIREKLHNFIDTADDKKVEAFFSFIEGELTEQAQTSSLATQKKMDIMKEASKDPLFLADLNEISDDFVFVDNENI